MTTLRFLLRLSHPPLLLIAAVLYFLGTGIARYFGLTIDWTIYGLGQIWLILVQFITYALNEYFETSEELSHPSKTLLTGSSGVLELGKLPRPTALWSSVFTGLAVGMITVLILSRARGSFEIPLIMLIMILVGLVNSIPPMRLSASGYGELLSGFFFTALVPVFAFTMQSGSLHRLLTLIALPLLFFYLALMLAIEFPDYASDSKYDRRNLLLRLGWQRGMILHNLLVVAGFLFLALAVFFGLPIMIAVPIIAVLPVGFVQIWLMDRIGQGKKPNWNLLMVLAVSTLGLTAYFLIYGFWTH